MYSNLVTNLAYSCPSCYQSVCGDVPGHPHLGKHSRVSLPYNRLYPKQARQSSLAFVSVQASVQVPARLFMHVLHFLARDFEECGLTEFMPLLLGKIQEGSHHAGREPDEVESTLSISLATRP